MMKFNEENSSGRVQNFQQFLLQKSQQGIYYVAMILKFLPTYLWNWF